MLIDQSTFFHVMKQPEHYGMKRIDQMICIKKGKSTFWFEAKPIGGNSQVVVGKSVSDAHVQARTDAVDSRGIYTTPIILAVGGREETAFAWAAYAPIDQYNTKAYVELRQAVERMASAV